MAIFDEKTIRKLNQLTLVANQVRSGVMKGDRRSSKRGSSIEFADYRNYTPGDDLRRLDWNIYARLERPFIKLLEEEEDRAVYVLLDGSQSMDWGEADSNKFHYALRLAAALGAITLSAGDSLSLFLISAGQLSNYFGPIRGVQNTLRTLTFLESQSPKGNTNLNLSLRTFAQDAHRPGLVILISDLFDSNGFISGIVQVQSRGHELVLLQVLSPDELDPPLAGDLRLVDVETGQLQEISLDTGMRSLYRERLADWRASLQKECRQKGVRCLSISTATPWDKIVLHEMRAAGMVK